MSRKAACIRTTESPAGSFTFATDETGAVIYARFDEGDYPVSMEDDLEARGYALDSDAGLTDGAARQLYEYTNGERRDFDIRLSPVGTEWQLSLIHI